MLKTTELQNLSSYPPLCLSFIKGCFCVLSTLGKHSLGIDYFRLTTTLFYRCYCDPHLTEEATEVQHGKQAWLGSHSKEAEELAFTPRPPEPTLLPLLLY